MSVWIFGKCFHFAIYRSIFAKWSIDRPFFTLKKIQTLYSDSDSISFESLYSGDNRLIIYFAKYLNLAKI